MLTEENIGNGTILLGPTQSGKSSFIASLLPLEEPNRPAVGRPAAGRSVTAECKVYSSTYIGPVLDSPGYNDTDRRVSAEEFTYQAASILEHCRGVRFLLVESLLNDAISLRRTQELLHASFSNSTGSNVVVLATKKDRLDEDELEERIESIMEVLVTIGLPDCTIVPWRMRCKSS